MIDKVVETAGESSTAAPVLVNTYLTVRQRCAELVSGTEVETEFQHLFPEIEGVPITAAASSLVRPVNGGLQLKRIVPARF